MDTKHGHKGWHLVGHGTRSAPRPADATATRSLHPASKGGDVRIGANHEVRHEVPHGCRGEGVSDGHIKSHTKLDTSRT
jgi:hypothetical protein